MTDRQRMIQSTEIPQEPTAPISRPASVLPTPNLRFVAGAALIALMAAVAYFPSIDGGFIWDDHDLLTESPLVRASDGLYRLWCTSEPEDYWPVTYTTFWIEWRLWGLHSTGYHVTNLILHVAEALLVWMILRKLRIPGAFLAALLFTVHPVNVESVAWISQRKNLMAMLFFLLSIRFYLQAETATQRADKTGTGTSQERFRSVRAKACSEPVPFLSARWYWLSLAAFLLAMLSKGSVAILPVVLLMIIWWLRPVVKGDLVRLAPFFVMAVALAAVNVWFQRHGTELVIRDASLGERLLGAGGVVWFYLDKAILPLNLAFIYPQWHIDAGNPLWWLPLAAVVVVTAVLWWYRDGWSRPWLWAWAPFCVALLPVMGLTDVYFMKYSLVADHYQHIAIIAVLGLAAAGWSVWHQRSRAGAAGGDGRGGGGRRRAGRSHVAAKPDLSR